MATGGLEHTTKHSRRFFVVIAIVLLSLVIVFSAALDLYQNKTPIPTDTGPVELEISPDKPYFLQGEDANFTVTIHNNKNQPITYPSSEQVKIEKDGSPLNGTGSNLHVTYPANNIPTYEANSNNSYTWTWRQPKSDNQTIPHEVGNYFLTMVLRGRDYEISANCIFEVRLPAIL